MLERINKKIIYYIKYNKLAYFIFYYSFELLIKIIKPFCKTDNKLILFNSYGGRRYDDSPKAIFDYINVDKRFTSYKLIWAFNDPKKFKSDNLNSIKIDSLKYVITALKAKVWITNSSIERGLYFKNNNTLYVNTWHGSPIKKLGNDLPTSSEVFKTKSKSNIDIINVQSDYEMKILSKCFNIPESNFIKTGLPRNDVLSKYPKSMVNSIKKKLDINSNKKIILYCPTFREYEHDSTGVIFIPPINLKKWQRELSNDYIVLFRSHYEVTKSLNIIDNSFIINVTNYPSINDLIIVSDILISDYSSIFFDYSITGKCMLYFTYDYDKYDEKRGLYFDIRNYIYGSDNEDGLINILKNIDIRKEKNKTKLFRKKFLEYYGKATEYTVDCIYNYLSKNG